ncbi:MAG: transposase [Planctomycetes bacterium]|nr:transposase [Planctomycetota bacterium]
MPRTARASVGGLCYHVLNRGNARRTVFHKDGDYAAFVKALADVCREVPLRPLAYCLMPNHFHLVLWPKGDTDLGRGMQWLLTTHVRRYHEHYHSSGHVWQGRFKAFPLEQDEHLLTVLRYVERNPLRAGLVKRAEDWPWSSLHGRAAGVPKAFLSLGPMPLPKDWLGFVNAALTDAELDRLRRSVARGTPFGADCWVRETAARLGLEASLRPRGRPRKYSQK